MVRYVKAGVETAFGAGAESVAGIRCSSISDTDDRGVMLEENIESYIYAAGFPGALKPGGTFEGAFRPKQMAPMLEALFGVKTPSGGDYIYTLGLPKSLEVRIGEQTYGGDWEDVHIGAAISSAKFTCEAKEIVKVSYDWFSKEYYDGTFDSAPTFSEEDPVVFWRAVVKINDSQNFGIRTLTIDVNRNMEEDFFVVGDFKRQGVLIAGMTEVGGDITFAEGEYAELRRTIYGTTAGVEVPDENTIGNVALLIECHNIAGDPICEISAPIALYTSMDRTISGQDTIDKKVSYKVVGSTFSTTVRA